MMVVAKTEDYQLLGEVLDLGPKELGESREDLTVELFGSDKQHVLDLYSSKGRNCSYKFYWPSLGMAYGNPRFIELGKVLTKVALEGFRMVLCSPDWGTHGGNEYWRTLLEKLTLTSTQLPDDAIYVPLGRKTPIRKPGWGSMLSVVDGSLAPVPWEDLDPTLVQEIQRENNGFLGAPEGSTPARRLCGDYSWGRRVHCAGRKLPPTSPAMYPILMWSQSVDYHSCLAQSTLTTKPTVTPSSCGGS